MATSNICGKRQGLVARGWLDKSLTGDHRSLEQGPDIIFLPKVCSPPPNPTISPRREAASDSSLLLVD